MNLEERLSPLFQEYRDNGVSEHLINVIEDDVKKAISQVVSQIQDHIDGLMRSWELEKHPSIRAEIHIRMEELNWIHKLITDETYDEFVKKKANEELAKIRKKVNVVEEMDRMESEESLRGTKHERDAKK